MAPPESRRQTKDGSEKVEELNLVRIIYQFSQYERPARLAVPSRLRIIGGSARGIKLDSPAIHLRPMMGKVREALFSTLTSLGLFTTKPPRVLDLYCGSGSVGLEALSRGAGEAIFVDTAEECCQIVKRNVDRCGFSANGRAVKARAEQALRNPSSCSVSGTFEIVSVTPPYDEVLYTDLIKDIMNSPALAEDTIVAIEYPLELGSLPFNIGDGRLLGLRNRRYGRTVLAIYVVRPTGRRSFELRPKEFAFASQAKSSRQASRGEAD